jgi:hypothetical protein
MDKTLADYIRRVTKAQQDEDKQRVAVNRNVWNDPVLAKQDQYQVYPEPESVNSDEKINPYSQH